MRQLFVLSLTKKDAKNAHSALRWWAFSSSSFCVGAIKSCRFFTSDFRGQKTPNTHNNNNNNNTLHSRASSTRDRTRLSEKREATSVLATCSHFCASLRRTNRLHEDADYRREGHWIVVSDWDLTDLLDLLD